MVKALDTPAGNDERETVRPRLTPIEPGTADRLWRFLQAIRDEYGVLPGNSVDLVHQAREEGLL